MKTLTEAIDYKSSSPAVIIPSGGPQFSYAQFSNLIADVQQQLAQLGIGHGSAVSIALPNGLEFAVCFLAVGAQRAIAAPLNSQYKQSEFEFYIDDLKSALVIVPEGHVQKNTDAVKAAATFQAAVAEIRWTGSRVQLNLKIKNNKLHPQQVQKAEPDDVALVLHTSGTTGRPKAVPLTHRNLTRTMHNIVETYKLTRSDRTLLVMPLFHVHGLLCGFLATLHSGGTVVLPDKFSAGSFWHDFIEHRVNWYTAVPTIHQILLKNPPPHPTPKIRFIRSCSSPLAPSTFHELERTFKAPVLEAYAMTEAAHQMTSNPLPPAKRKPGSVGLGQGVDVAILDDQGRKMPQGKDGEICVRGENVTKGYLNNDQANRDSFTKDGFFRTGDQGILDEDGYVIITGRIKELINRGGEKISPIEVDSAMLAHPSVGEAVCFAVPDELYGQEVHATVVLREGKKATEQEIKDFVSQRVSKFKVPKKIYFTDVMPKTATGKIQRRNIAEKFFKKDEQKKSKL